MLDTKELVKLANSVMDKTMMLRHGSEKEVPATIALVWKDQHIGLLPMLDAVSQQNDFINYTIRAALQRLPEVEGVLFLSEAFVSLQEAPKKGEKLKYQRASEDPDRSEALFLVGETRTGDQFSITATIKNNQVGPKIMRVMNGKERISGRMSDWFNPAYDRDLDQRKRDILVRSSAELAKLLEESHAEAIKQEAAESNS